MYKFLASKSEMVTQKEHTLLKQTNWTKRISEISLNLLPNIQLLSHDIYLLILKIILNSELE